MPKACVKKKIAGGMSAKAAHAACYPKKESLKKMPKSPLKRAGVSVKASIGGMKARRAIKKYEKKSGSKLTSYS